MSTRMVRIQISGTVTTEITWEAAESRLTDLLATEDRTPEEENERLALVLAMGLKGDAVDELRSRRP